MNLPFSDSFTIPGTSIRIPLAGLLTAIMTAIMAVIAAIGIAIPATSGGSSEVTDPAKLENVQDLTPRKDIEQPQNTRWHSFQKVGDTQVRVFFDMGNDNCYGAYATVKETAVSVDIDVFTGGLPEAPEACTLEMGVNNSLLVTLEKPLGQRVLH